MKIHYQNIIEISDFRCNYYNIKELINFQHKYLKNVFINIKNIATVFKI